MIVHNYSDPSYCWVLIIDWYLSLWLFVKFILIILKKYYTDKWYHVKLMEISFNEWYYGCLWNSYSYYDNGKWICWMLLCWWKMILMSTWTLACFLQVMTNWIEIKFLSMCVQLSNCDKSCHGIWNAMYSL